MVARKEFCPKQPLKGMGINGSLHMTINTSVLIETLQALVAKVALVLLEHLQHPGSRRRSRREAETATLVDDGGDATLLIHTCKEFQDKFAKEMVAKGELLFPAVNVNDCVTTFRFDNVYGCRHSLPDGIMRATDVTIRSERALIYCYGDVGKVCIKGFQVVAMESAVSEMDICAFITGNLQTTTLEHMKKMKNSDMVGNIGHLDNEIEMEHLEKFAGVEVKNVKPQVACHVFSDGYGIVVLAAGRLLSLSCATPHPSSV
ncbi:unnamed protein product, partial [Prorocentrum cordatum]